MQSALLLCADTGRERKSAREPTMQEIFTGGVGSQEFGSAACRSRTSIAGMTQHLVVNGCFRHPGGLVPSFQSSGAAPHVRAARPLGRSGKGGMDADRVG